MIITRTPFRISFAGGGTDLKSFYTKEPGAVVSTTINKYMYLSVHRPFDHHILLKYSKTELLDKIEDIKHPLIREAMRFAGVFKGIDITSTSDIPAGTGLGTSSSFTVGLLNSLYAYRGINASAEKLAREACHIEIELVGSPIGKQDQYAAAYGGLNYIQFNPDETVVVRPLVCSKRKELDNNLLLFYTGASRDANLILSEQSKVTQEQEKFAYLKKMREQTKELISCLEGGNIDRIGEIMHEGWIMKKSLTPDISNKQIDSIYKKALDAGAIGGKLVGAGGGGFLLLYIKPENQDKVRKALIDLVEVQFCFDAQGSRIIYVGD